MKKFVNGDYVDMTTEEVAEMKEEEKRAEALVILPTEKQRISAIESAIADLAILLANNENIKEE